MVLATFTANPLEPYLGMALSEAGLPSTIATGPFDQIATECLNDASPTALAEPTTLVVWPRFEDVWRGRPLPLSDDLEGYLAPFRELADVALAAANRWSSLLVFVLPARFEIPPLGVGDDGNPRGVAAACEVTRHELRQMLGARSGVLVLDADDVVRTLGTGAALNARTLTTARVPYSQAMFLELAERIARLLRIARRGARKVAVVDADNTLWAGVVGEDGADGIDLLDNGPGEAHREFQRWLLELRRAGMLITVASKNSEGAVWEAFARPEMVVQRDDLSSWRINWESKGSNILEIADEISLGISSFVFIDDNPIEIEDMRREHPDVLALRMPSDPSNWAVEIARSGALDRFAPTAEDVSRAESYRAETQRKVARSQVTTEEYLRTLAITVAVFAPETADLSRLSQLFAKTNQFTLGGRRFSESELVAMMADPSVAMRLFRVVDRFGDYGTVGAIVVQNSELDGFVLSCRAMGRGVEEAMIAEACVLAGGPVSVSVQDSGKNIPGLQFFARLGALPGQECTLNKQDFPPHIQLMRDRQ